MTVPAGTADGLHPVVAVSSPNGGSAAFSVVVDGTPPPAPAFTRTPGTQSGDATTFEFTEADASATVECKLDSAPYSACTSPVDLVALPAGARTFSVRATDAAGNVGAVANHTWTVDTNALDVAVSFPSAAARVNDAAFVAGCATLGGDVFGTADDEVNGIAAMAVSLRRGTTGLYWNGSGFAAAAETFLPALGTDSWSYAIGASAFPAEGDYVLRARATDGGGAVGYDSRTFTVDRTAPTAPVLTMAPPATSGPSVSVAYSTDDASATFQCRLDGGGWAACPTPQTLGGLAGGAHTFECAPSTRPPTPAR